MLATCAGSTAEQQVRVRAVHSCCGEQESDYSCGDYARHGRLSWVACLQRFRMGAAVTRVLRRLDSGSAGKLPAALCCHVRSGRRQASASELRRSLSVVWR